MTVESGIVMNFINSRKFSCAICGIGCLIAIISFFFLPNIIPTHFVGGVADGFGNKIQIFLFPALQMLLTFLSGKEKIKYYMTHSKRFLTDNQFQWMIGGVLIIVMMAEVWVIYSSFA
ncbi:DUF1648 domain-containing protein [Hespellia stercorisuis]|uniref:DUF1648 domain-containing protein n=1 Tax=Hespellia stercorisuis TaxID=180311 RepID=UPI002E8E2FD1|nr:DUF1648 domain-containing protein [Hespellia stercorisuis]